MTSTDLRPAAATLLAISREPRPWYDVEASLGEDLGGPGDLFLGGDGLRPYVTWSDPAEVHLLAYHRPDLPPPPFVNRMEAGAWGLATRQQVIPGIAHYRVAHSAGIATRLDAPQLLLVGLGDAARYRAARLPLGIARLAQWMRFTHSARVEIVDYTSHDAPLDRAANYLRSNGADVVGISINFGQWHMLEEMADVVNDLHSGPVVLGNILAAYSPARAARPFMATREGKTFIATSLGERPLESLCRNIRQPEVWHEIPGLRAPEAAEKLQSRAAIRQPPPELVFPDDSLVLDIAERGGQISLETSFGCQFGACTFCPRDHRGEGWERGSVATAVATVERLAGTGAVVSFVDEEFFGSEGLLDPPSTEFAAATLLRHCRELGVQYEIYTRLEQLFDRRRSHSWNRQRAEMLTSEAAAMRRIFVGVESGSPSQLRRYGKGQTVPQIVDSLRIGSALGVPMEFGFITFDPLLTPGELAENMLFLGRTDVMCSPADSRGAALETVERYLNGEAPAAVGTPVYQHVAYMATELEVLAHSRYVDHLQRRHPSLLDGTYDSSFARHGARYRDERIGHVAAWCRVWTEGMFTAVYEARMSARAASGATDATAQARRVVNSYRDATYSLMSELISAFLPELREPLGQPAPDFDAQSHASVAALLDKKAHEVLASAEPVDFDLSHLQNRRDR